MSHDLATFLAAIVASIVAGAVNAIAGGGSLITFPTLVGLGLPPVVANVTNTVALCPGYFGATIAQKKDLEGQGKRAAMLLPVAALGGVGGALLLLYTDEKIFAQLVPFLLLFAALLVGVQTRVRKWLFGHDDTKHRAEAWALLPVAAASVYGGYFGAGLGVITLAALGIVLADSLTRINALKQALSLFVNVAAAALFVFSDKVDWPICGVMFAGALVGGMIGGKVASKVPAHVLRACVVVLGVTLAIVYFVK